MDVALLELLRCPDEHHAELTHDAAAQTLTCTQCRRVFEIRAGIPVLLLEEARMPAPQDEPAASPRSALETAPETGP